MKKWIYIICLIVIVIVAICIGKVLFKTNNKKNEVNTINKTVQNEVNISINNNTIMSTSTKQEKISPNATLTLEKQYKECGHVIKEYKEIPEELVNLTQDEISQKYKNWEIEKFTPLELILIKQEEGFCNEHYVLKQKDDVIAVYKINEDGTENLEEMTGISIEYLTENDKLEIRDGIEVYGKEELNSVLENYE